MYEKESYIDNIHPLKIIGDVAGPEPVLFLVTFDKEGKVIAYDTVKEHHHPIR